MKYIVGGITEINRDNADVNNDSNVDILDVVRLIRSLAYYGDVNFDETVGFQDAEEILLYTNQRSSVFDQEVSQDAAVIAADVNHDDHVDARDATQILRYSNGLPSTLESNCSK